MLSYLISSCHSVPGECSDSVCDLVSCSNGGVCFANRADGYICLCPLGFRGSLCEESESTLFSRFSHLHKAQISLLSIVRLQMQLVKSLLGLILLHGCCKLSYQRSRLTSFYEEHCSLLLKILGGGSGFTPFTKRGIKQRVVPVKLHPGRPRQVQQDM